MHDFFIGARIKVKDGCISEEWYNNIGVIRARSIEWFQWVEEGSNPHAASSYFDWLIDVEGKSEIDVYERELELIDG